MTADEDWAAQAFDFAWGSSELSARLKALEDLVGSQAELIRLAGIEGTAYKMAIKRGSAMPSDRIDAIARATGVSLDYLVRGTPLTARDAECEEMRFDMAARQFAPPSSAARRESRQLLIAQRRREVEDQIARLAAAGVSDPGAGYAAPTAPAGFILVPPLQLTARALPGLSLQTAEPAPIALSAAWLADHQTDPDKLASLPINGNEGGPEFPAGSIVIVDTADRDVRLGTVFAMDIGGEVQLRRVITRLAGSIELLHVNADMPLEVAAKGDPLPVLGAVVFSVSPLGRC